MPIDAQLLLTGIVLAFVTAIGSYAWRQGRKVDALYQSLYGAPQMRGALSQLNELEGKLTTLVTAVATMSVTVELLTKMLDERRTTLDRRVPDGHS
jgi:hypothetical protein